MRGRLHPRPAAARRDSPDRGRAGRPTLAVRVAGASADGSTCVPPPCTVERHERYPPAGPRGRARGCAARGAARPPLTASWRCRARPATAPWPPCWPASRTARCRREREGRAEGQSPRPRRPARTSSWVGSAPSRSRAVDSRLSVARRERTGAGSATGDKLPPQEFAADDEGGRPLADLMRAFTSGKGMDGEIVLKGGVKVILKGAMVNELQRLRLRQGPDRGLDAQRRVRRVRDSQGGRGRRESGNPGTTSRPGRDAETRRFSAIGRRVGHDPQVRFHVRQQLPHARREAPRRARSSGWRPVAAPRAP